MRKVAIVIVHFGSSQNTLDTLTSVKKLKKDDLDISTIVVDNNQTSDEQIEKEIGKGKYIANKKNLGFAEGNNVGIRAALKNGANFILILNNDTILDENLLVQLIATAEGGVPLRGKAAKKEENAGILSPKIYFASGFEFHRERYKLSERGRVIWYVGGLIDWDNILASHRGVDEVDKGQYEDVAETYYATGACMLVKRKVFEKIGLFDSDYFLYWEDADFCQRARKHGFKILYAPPAHLWHKNAGASRVGSPLHDYYLTRNRLFFGMKYAVPRTKRALILDSLRILMWGRVWQRRGVLDYYFGNLGKGSYPIG